MTIMGYLLASLQYVSSAKSNCFGRNAIKVNLVKHILPNFLTGSLIARPRLHKMQGLMTTW